MSSSGKTLAANHGLLEKLEHILVVEGASCDLLERVAARDMPPAVDVLIFLREIREGNHDVFFRFVAERSTLQGTILREDMVVQLGVALLVRDHRKKQHILSIHLWVLDFEPEFDRRSTGPFGDVGGVEGDIAILGV